MAIGNWGSLFVINPPVVKGSVWSDKETLFRWWGFSKGIGDVGSKNEHVLCGRDSIEQAGASLINTVGVRLVEDLNGSGATLAAEAWRKALSAVSFVSVRAVDRDAICEDVVCTLFVRPSITC